MRRLNIRQRKGKRGFTLIELLIVMAILAILAGVVVLSVGNIFTSADEAAYDVMRHQIQQAVTAYMSNSSHIGELPLIGANVTIDGKVLEIIDICKTKVPEGMLRKAPEGCYEGPDALDDNCDTGTCICDPAWHYRWAVDKQGNLYSQCMNSVNNSGGCANESSDGFQNIWP